MKKLIQLFTILLFTIHFSLAQTPQAFNYQAVVRDKDGKLLTEKSIDIRVSLIKDSITGVAVYTETQKALTNKMGLVNLEIGKGTPAEGDFKTIDWSSGKYFLKMEIDIDGNGYIQTGISQLLSVPYALYADKANVPGLAGPTGATGEKGDKGDKGEIGATGPKGDKGVTGSIGATGPKGDKGEIGATGPKGDKGESGSIGATGATGPKGDTGPAGSAFNLPVLPNVQVLLNDSGKVVSDSNFVFDKKTGNVGIGNIKPMDKLSVTCTDKAGGITINAKNYATLQFRRNDTLKHGIQYWNGGLNFYRPGKDGDLFINNNGYVGIGKTNPQAGLHINNYSYIWANWQNFISLEGSQQGAITFNDPSSKTGWLMGFHTLNKNIYWAYMTNNLQNGDYKMQLSSTGCLSVGELVVSSTWSDFVFEDDYKLMPLYEVEKYIKANKCLPDIPSAAEVQAEGVKVGDNQAKLLQKIEELTLYLIDLKKENDTLKKRIEKLEKNKK